jgi:phosphopantothenoylcysteine synthetase/decarboxylase
MTTPGPTRVLYVVACAAGPAPHVGRLVGRAQRHVWDVRVIPTPAAVEFLDVAALEAQTGHAVRSEDSGAADRPAAPAADAIIVAPATSNTINKWARGFGGNRALGILAEAIGLAIPTVVLPFVNSAHAAHPAFGRSVAVLRGAGVSVVLGPGEFEPHPPRTGAGRLEAFPWQLALDRVAALVAATAAPDVD